jgi:4-hydroxymandelate oxidase
VDLRITNLLELEGLARTKIPQAAFDYIAGGAEDEVSLRRNREAFGRWSLRPRVLANVSNRDLSTTALGTKVSLPVLVAPTAFHGLVHPEGELATAQGAAAAGTIMVVSTIATRTLEQVASAAPEAPRWFQLYVYRDRRVTEDLVDRAVRTGYRALVLTVDTPVLGRRERDEWNQFALPPGMGIANVRPHGLDELAPLDQGSALAKYAADLLSPALTWDDVEWLKSVSSVPVAVKGIMTAEDGRLAIEHGADAVVVSNHGGRQLDGTVGTLDALPEVVEAVAGRAEVFVDGGVRRGTDVLKALALGARAVLLGRPVLWGLALGGADGVREVFGRLREELDSAMAIAGRPTLASVDRSLVQRAP